MVSETRRTCRQCGGFLHDSRQKYCSENCRWLATPSGQKWKAKHPDTPSVIMPLTEPIPRKLDKETRALILERDNGVCQYCGDPGDTVDHVVPFSLGGHSTPENLVCACWPCNSVLRARNLGGIEEKRAFLAYYWSPEGAEIRTSPKRSLIKPRVWRGL